MIKRISPFLFLPLLTINVLGCSTKNNYNTNYLLTKFDSDTSNNSFLVSNQDDLKTIIGLDSFNSVSKKYDNGFFANKCLVVFKIVESDHPRGINTFSIKDGDLNIILNSTKNIYAETMSQYFYILELNKMNIKEVKYIKIYDGDTLLSKRTVQKETYYSFLRNFDLRDEKKPLFSYQDFYLEESGLSYIIPKTTTTEYLLVEKEYLDIDEITSIKEIYSFFSEPHSLIAIQVEFMYRTKEEAYEILKMMQKLEFSREIKDSTTSFIDV